MNRFHAKVFQNILGILIDEKQSNYRVIKLRTEVTMIQKLVGHNSKTTLVYLHKSNNGHFNSLVHWIT